jgi:hypothetical protein
MDLAERLKTARAVARLSEYFDIEDLLILHGEFKAQKMDLDESFRALDGQVRFDYWVTQREPQVNEYLKRMCEMYGKKPLHNNNDGI